MKTLKLIYLILCYSGIFCLLNLCYGDDKPKDPIQTLKHSLIDDEGPNGVINKTNDLNRTEVMAQLKQILEESLAHPDASNSARYAGAAIIAYSNITKENSSVLVAKWQPFLNYPNLGVQRLAIRYISNSGDPSSVGLLQSKLQEVETKLPDKDVFNSQTEKTYQSVFQIYFELILGLNKIGGNEAAEIRDQSLARFKTKYQDTNYGQTLIQAYAEMSARKNGN